MESSAKEIIQYQTPDGKIPFEEWIKSLRDQRAKDIIRARLARVRLGNLGDLKSVGHGIHEMRIDWGPGYRIYLGQMSPRVIVILCAGDKSSQVRDIRKAQDYWSNFKETNS